MNLSPARRAARPAPLADRVCTRCVAMSRSSTKQQLLTHGAQADIIANYAGYKGIAVARLFDDRGTDGKSTFLERPVVREALAYMEAEGLDTIICTRMNRFFRNMVDAVVTLDTLFRHGVFLHFCENNVDPSTPMGRAMFQFMAMMAELDTGMRQQCQLDAFDQQRKLGQKSGVNVPYGQRAVPAAQGRQTKERNAASDLVPDPEQQQVLGWMLRLRGEGFDDGHIATALNRAGVPSAKAGQMIKYRGVVKPCRGTWSEASVRSVLEFARLADPRLRSRNPDEVEEAVAALGKK